MRERLKRVVLKTTVRETVPGVRIPLPPPENLLSGLRHWLPSRITALGSSDAGEKLDT
jgi:hypothetical protein